MNDEVRFTFSALLTAWGVDRQEEKETAGEDGRPREPHGFLSPRTANYFNTTLAQSVMTRSAATGEYKKRLRFSSCVLLCSRSSPPVLINLSYACWTTRTYIRSPGPRLHHYHHDARDKEISTRTKHWRRKKLIKIFLPSMED